MKRIVLLNLFVIVLIPCFGQFTSLPIETTFKNGMILFTLPPAYNSPEYLPVAKPRYVHIQRTLVNKDYNPSFSELHEVLQSKLLITPLNSSEDKISYLKLICLYIYTGNNNTTKLPAAAREHISDFMNDESFKFREEAKLTADYLIFADNMTTKFGMK